MTGPATELREHSPESWGDHWLDDVTEPAAPAFSRPTQLAMSSFAGPARLVRRLYSFAATTPGKLFTLTLILTVALAAAGFSMSSSSAARHDDLDALLTSTEPMSNAAHHLYTNLSLADTVATTGFVQAGVEPVGNRERYNEAIDAAAVAATQSVVGSSADDERVRELVTFIQRELPVYTALVEKARVNHRAGNAVANSYMSNASALMRTRILPAAAELFTLTSEKVTHQQQRLTRPQWVPLSGLVAALIFLGLAQWWLWRLTRRRLNRGFVLATSLLFIALVWASAANFATWASGHQGFETVSRPWDSLTASRIEAQQMRTSETLALVLRSSQEDMSVHFNSTVYSVNHALRDYEQALGEDSNPALIPQAQRAVEDWAVTHEAFMDSLSTGNYDTAVYQATAIDPDGEPTAASAFNAVDNSLALLIDEARESMREYLMQGLNAMTLVSTGVSLATFGAIIAVWLGIRPRLQEYL
ncbi:hypothetical protein [Corynebacterium minutissimum]|uniref:Hypothetical membrane protein n=1 Tax=Corynebacterium minutissimum TaxID=38301 RepID=A0A2X4RHK3_9CORY|nr:hypothetical protein [Corynebacterium minutissimum]KHO28550.1 membrane protein [Corynebacterium minutissimum]QPS59744.1 hypothetical protein I6G51_00505 [Corynebacterium minutissimum]QQA79466.1 hypothetical protein I6H49_12340 [Corynebacterium minutissimum]QRP61819.1 hypothetical protein I6J26_04655 [Corynebacterium minutissimum]SQH98488.1 hypothetical membrane protein [Corynebacterium minutissimum]